MRLTAVLIGMVFGALLWLSGMADYDVIHRGLLFREPHLYLMMVASTGTAVPLLWWCERRGVRTVFGGPLAINRERPKRKHVAGGVTFGVGWALAGTCPGAVIAMAAGGRVNALWAIAGIGAGVLLRDTVEKRRDAGITTALTATAIPLSDEVGEPPPRPTPSAAPRTS